MRHQSEASLREAVQAAVELNSTKTSTSSVPSTGMETSSGAVIFGSEIGFSQAIAKTAIERNKAIFFIIDE